MYEKQPIFKEPEDENVKVWRYMDFTKLIDILERESLYFTRADKFDDPFEGISSKVTKEKRLQYINDTGGKLQGKLRESSELLDQKVREWTVINCWHMNEYESDAMWKLYVQSNEGIAIQSTFKKLCNSFSNVEEGISLGQVNYIDYELDDMQHKEHMLSPFVYKRKSFEHERELRAMIMRIPEKGNRFDYKGQSFNHGVYVQVNLEELIDKIYVAPTAPQWIFKLVELMLIKYGLGHKKVLKSPLLENPSL
ncbi:DUF2971 domain-containing protein [Bacillus mycoides]|uniref:DUF2971 domain-containing protein n=1 Tax=Bacillus mycoides TaxID=1405 RepID=UPI001C02C861|nr:DUF2971 domain-containing protein [Bacillus mycoides]QWH51240.1 hypothetical protein EXW44_13920 [Bacillus mycoides]QWI98261.1 hypothetical protein J5V93_13650 [Bacillus mycoides]